MNLQGAATQMRLCNHDRCIDPTNDLTTHQANTGDPLYGSSVPNDAILICNGTGFPEGFSC